jgi:mono/diheme cytochrome c family protein
MTVKITTNRTLETIAGLMALSCMLHAQSPARSVWDGVFTEDQAKRGEALSNRSCARCHGAALVGGEAAPALTGENFLANWDGQTAGDLFDRIRKTMPQDKPGTLTPQVNADILAYILSLNHFPAGKDELPVAADSLRQIRIEAVKPDRK